MPSITDQPQTFSAFEGKLSGNSIKGVSLLQKGPALGHGVWVDDTTLSQAKKSAASIGKLKAKQNHWSGIEDTIGYYENFRVKDGKLVADLTLFDAAPGTPLLLQMIDNIPGTFGVSISFGQESPEYDKEQDRYNARVRELYSADFVDTPAANRDGVFEVIDRNNKDMPAITQEAFDALKTDSDARLSTLLTKIEALEEAVTKPAPVEPPAPEPAPVAPVVDNALAAQMAEVLTFFKAQQLSKPPVTPVAPPAEPEPPAVKKSYAQLKAEHIGDAKGFERSRLAFEFDANAKAEGLVP